MADETRHRIGLLVDHPGTPRAEQALDALQAALDAATFSEPDDVGAFEAQLDAPSFEGALELVWNAVAAAGVDDQIRLAEHPDLPEHWRHRAASP